MKKDFNTGLRKGIEADRVKLTRRRKLLLREMGGGSHTLWPSSITGAMPAGSITSRQAYGAGMPAILIICRW